MRRQILVFTKWCGQLNFPTGTNKTTQSKRTYWQPVALHHAIIFRSFPHILFRLCLHQHATDSLFSRCQNHDAVIKWKHFPRYRPFARGIHRSPVNSPHKGQWQGALMFSLICALINGRVNNRKASDLRRHRAHYDVTVMWWHIWPDSVTLLNVYVCAGCRNCTGSVTKNG